MPVATNMSHAIPTHILRVGHSVRQGNNQGSGGRAPSSSHHYPSPNHFAGPGCPPEEKGSGRSSPTLDVSLESLNQLILDLDPSFEPLQVNKKHPSRSSQTDSSPDDDISNCVLVPRGCSLGFRGPAPSQCVAIPPRSSSAASPQGSLVFSGSPSASRPPLPWGALRRPSVQQGELWGTACSPGALRMSGQQRFSAASLLSTSPGSDTSYLLGSNLSLVSDEADGTDCPALHSPAPPSPWSGTAARGRCPASPYPDVSPPTLGDWPPGIPTVLVNGVPEPPEVGPRSPLFGSSGYEAKGPQMQTLQRAPGASSPKNHIHCMQNSMKFVMDTSQFWFRPHITREEADVLLRDKEPGSFVVRDSTSYRGCFGLAMKVHQGASNTSSITEGASVDVRNFLIESSAKGVRIKGSSQEPYFGSLPALVYQHTISAYALPCKLVIHTTDLSNGDQKLKDRSVTEDSTKTACNFLYLNAVPTEMLTGPCAVQRAVTATLEKSDSIATPTIVNLKVSPKGVTLTDIQRKLFFRRHYPAHLLSYSGEDPDRRMWKKNCKSARLFGIVAKGMDAGQENVCHVFAEYDPLQPCGQTIQIAQGILQKQ